MRRASKLPFKALAHDVLQGRRKFSYYNIQLIYSAFKRAKSFQKRLALLTLFSTLGSFWCYSMWMRPQAEVSPSFNSQ